MATYEKIKEYINNAIFYDREYDVINELIKYGDPKFFAKILEEVVDGNMYWIDFYPILDTPRYKEMLRDELKNQDEMYKELSRMSEFRKNVVNNVGIVQSHKDYEKLAKEYGDEKIYNIMQYDAKDSVMTIACKSAIFNAVENYKLLDKNNGELSLNTDYEDDNGITIQYRLNNFGELQKYDTSTDTVEFFDYLNPDDIIYSADDIILPIDSRYQTLDDADIAFMMNNNISESKMKQFKALRAFLSVNLNHGGDSK